MLLDPCNFQPFSIPCLIQMWCKMQGLCNDYLFSMSCWSRCEARCYQISAISVTLCFEMFDQDVKQDVTRIPAIFSPSAYVAMRMSDPDFSNFSFSWFENVWSRCYQISALLLLWYCLIQMWSKMLPDPCKCSAIQHLQLWECLLEWLSF